MKQACFMEANSLRTRWQKLHLWGPKKECAKFYVRLQLQMKKVLALFHFITAFFSFLHLQTKLIFLFC